MGQFGWGQPVRRKEDPRLLTGRGRFVADRRIAGECHAFILRSPHAHAELRAIDAAAAREAPGVIAVLSGQELAADGIGGIPSDFTLPFYPPRAGPPFPVFHPPFHFYGCRMKKKTGIFSGQHGRRIKRSKVKRLTTRSTGMTQLLHNA